MAILLEGREICGNTRLHRLTLTSSSGYCDKTREMLIRRGTARGWRVLRNEYSQVTNNNIHLLRRLARKLTGVIFCNVDA